MQILNYNEQIKQKNQIISRLRRKLKMLTEGNLSDGTLLNAIRRRVQGFLLTFITMQLFHKPQSSYTEEAQQLAKKMHYTSPSLYAKMRHEFNFILPGRSIISKWFSSVNLWPGICNSLFLQFKSKVDCMDISERNCVLLVDEMRIKKCFDFHVGRQKVEGFEDLGSLGCTKKVATNALVFMVRGLLHNWKQPVAYFLTSNAVKNIHLASLLNEVIDAILSTGLKIRAIVCDQSANNRSTIKNRISVDRPYFIHGNQKIYTIFDIPHIYKSIRNQLLKYDIMFDDNKIASWKDVRSLWQLEDGKATRAACKLSEKHIYPNNFEKMKCRLALQVFSRKVSAALLTAGTVGGIESQTVMHTAEFFRMLNDTFDSLNSRSCNDSNPDRCALSEIRLNAENNLIQLLEKCSKWRTITNNGLNIPPCFEGLEISVKAILQLWDDLKCDGIKFFMTSRVNQDPLENLFSMIRTYGGTYNLNPSAKAFRLTLQKNIVINLAKPAQSANCLDDEDETLFPSSKHGATSNIALTPTNASREREIDDEMFVDVEEIAIEASYVNDETLEASAVEYFAGFVAMKCIKKSGCEQCSISLISENHEYVQDRQILTFFRAYETNDNELLGHLCAPSAEFSFVFKLINAVFDAGYPNIREKYGIQDILFPLMVEAVDMKYPGWFQHETCGLHRKDLAYYMMKVKIHKDLVWLGNTIRRPDYRHKPVQKLRNVQSM